MLPNVSEYLQGKNVFVTGVTGFVGLALVEKLLRTVPDIGNIYLLIRPKHDKLLHERLNEIKLSSIFETLKNKGNESALEKLIGIEGRIDDPNLDLDAEALGLLISKVDFVFHCAATLDFEASLKTSVEVNLMGTQNVIDLCKIMANLKAFVHVSSAFTNADKLNVDEILYPPPEDKDKVVELVQTLSKQHLEEVTPSLLKKHPNTYTFSKALAEHEVSNAFSKIPTCIVRPSMIIGVWKDPVPGWTNSKNGPQGFIMGAAMGVIRRLPVATHLIYDYIPVDVVVNTMIAGAVYTASNKDQLAATPIFQCTSSTCNPFRWMTIEDTITGLLHKYPAAQAVWYPHFKLIPSVELFQWSALIFHMIPAYIFDTFTKVTGGRPKLVKLHTSVNKSLERLEPFIFQEWKFNNSRCLELHDQLSPQDKEIYGMDIRTLSWEHYFDDMALGVRRFLLKENDSSLPKARTKRNVLMVANVAVQSMVVALLFSCLECGLGFSGLSTLLIILPVLILIYIYL